MIKMSKSKKTRLFVILASIIAIVALYYLFLADKVIAPESTNNFSQSSLVASSTATQGNYQNIENGEVQAHVLMYHHIGALPSDADDIRKGLTVSAQEFDSHVKYLTENNYQIMTLGQLDQAIEQKKVPTKVAVLTFDDGYSDNFTDALPILKKYKVVGTFFIISSKLDTSEYMTKDQIKELSKDGNEIGSHTLTHPSLDKLKGTALTKEVAQSKTDLEALTGVPVISFCYPSGKYNDDTIKAVTDAGYKIAVTTHASTGIILTNQLLEVSRYRISSSMSFPALFR